MFDFLAPLAGVVYPLLSLFLILGVLAAVGLEGLWSATLMLVNIIVAGLIALGFYEPLAAFAQDYFYGGAFFWDWFFLGSLFAISVYVLRAVTDFMSPRKVRFPEMADTIGGPVMGAVCGYALLCFLSVGMQVVPLEPKPMGGSYVPGQGSLVGLDPGSQFLGFTYYQASGALAPLLFETDLSTLNNFQQTYTRRRELYATPKSNEAGPSGVWNTPAGS